MFLTHEHKFVIHHSRKPILTGLQKGLNEGAFSHFSIIIKIGKNGQLDDTSSADHHLVNFMIDLHVASAASV